MTAEIRVPRRAMRIWDTDLGGWCTVAGRYRLRAGRSFADLRAEVEVDLTGELDGQVDMAK